MDEFSYVRDLDLKNLAAPIRGGMANTYRDVRKIDPALARLIWRRVKKSELAFKDQLSAALFSWGSE